MSNGGTLGNHFEHEIEAALRTGRAESAWVLLRNLYFRDGTPREGYDEMVAACAARGVAVRSIWRQDEAGKEMQFVVFTPRLPLE